MINDSNDNGNREAVTTNHFIMGRRSDNSNIISDSKVDVTLNFKWKADEAATIMF